MLRSKEAGPIIRKLLPNEHLHWSSKMFLLWISGIFNVKIQSEKGHKFMYIIYHNKVKDLLDICKWGCSPFYMTLLTDKTFNRTEVSDFVTFSNNGRFYVCACCIKRCITFSVTSPNFNTLNVVTDLLLAKKHRKNILQRPI